MTMTTTMASARVQQSRASIDSGHFGQMACIRKKKKNNTHTNSTTIRPQLPNQNPNNTQPTRDDRARRATQMHRAQENAQRYIEKVAANRLGANTLKYQFSGVRDVSPSTTTTSSPRRMHWPLAQTAKMLIARRRSGAGGGAVITYIIYTRRGTTTSFVVE